MVHTHENLQKFLNDIIIINPIEEIELYEEAFIHSSNNSHPNNQRLAFLGDSVLKLIIREHFYDNYPDWDKGKLTQISDENEKNEHFANIAIKLGLSKYMDISNLPGSDTHEKLNAEVLEALFGAIFLNRGFAETRKIAEKFILTNLVTVG